ncbi:very-short-patch-repair endonuclease [Kitasatospora sp. MAA4]|uniref:DUF3320 domain-containing protein n=1 Tax=Kitasatospora sp. MAA4 TaxID=3035093 RepID=UPI0024746784|nr:DUF3320 domain-containing protein [Kitasatospora sp. MAA4]MDH6132483.1 very-short-patch-repair endonuclease [Kitasatospora sp. MAA4]
MDDQRSTATTDPGLDRLRTVLTGWRTSLLDMGGRNRLLNFRHTRTGTLEIIAPDAVALVAGLTRGWDFESPSEEPEEPSDARPAIGGRSVRVVTQKTTQAGLDASLTQLRLRSAQMFNDYGLWVLWLGFGMLDWREAGATESSAAPLVLIPVTLRRDRDGRPRLYAAEDQEPIHNPALSVKLAGLGVDWQSVAELDCANLPAVVAAASQVAAQQDGWEVADRLVLGLFASHRESMYQDLLQNEQRILSHPLIRAIGLGPDSGLPADLIGFEPPALDRIDELQIPEQTPLVLDADASQRQCIAAAMAGRSFVMNGPPGTGKSQTIANMIAALMHSGRTVLFVSEKAAALDVVRNRLASVGLADLVLALHSGDTTKRAVAQELNRVLTSVLPAVGAAEHELSHARQLREELSAHAAAMNETRQPLGRSLHAVIGRVVALEAAGIQRLTLRPAASRAVRELSAQGLQELQSACDAVARAWRPVLETDRFVWRGLRDRTEYGRSPLAALAEAEDALAELRSAVDQFPLRTARPAPQTSDGIAQAAAVVRAGLPRTDGAPVGEPVLRGDQSSTLAVIADSFGVTEPDGVDAALALCGLADLADAPHRPAAGWFVPEVFEQVAALAEELRAAVAELAARAGAAADVFTEEVLGCDELVDLERRFAEAQGSLATRMSRRHRTDKKAVAALARAGVRPKAVQGRLRDAVAWQHADRALRRLVADSAALLERYAPTDAASAAQALAPLDQALQVGRRISLLARGAATGDSRELNLPRLAGRLADGVPPDQLTRAQVRSVRLALSDWCAVAEERSARWSTGVRELLQLFDEARSAELLPQLLGSLALAEGELRSLRDDADGPQEWQAFRDGRTVLGRSGLDDLPVRVAERGIGAGQFAETVELAVCAYWVDRLLESDPRLRTARAADLDARVEAFRQADQRLVTAAGGTVAAACNARRPRNPSIGAGGLIVREAEKKTRHLPVRELLGRTRDVVRSVKPCFMMSPLTVSQFLPPDYDFDVVIFDEASQVRPSDAINCVYRAAALIVAGDEKQLPPTSFFGSSAEDESEEYDEDVPDSFESLLDACKAGAMRALPLRWHYRSRHEDLITFSNRSFYDNSMITFPGAQEHGPDVGVELVPADGSYDRGGRRDNWIEAQAVARRVVHHFDTRPGRSLGVVALSQAQAAAIELAVQQARIARPDLEHCFTEGRLDGFFVKNLESVQGDERDVMIMSIGYGPDEHGKLGLNFGPINREGGWRRLNVAVTRARYRVEVVSSFTGGQLKDSTNPSVQHLKRYLEYAEHGPSVLSQDLVQEEREPDSPFEVAVLGVLRDWGYLVQPQVGVAGFRIDLGVRHPAAEGSFALGIECDGAMYHSSRAARDRDRLREQVLTGLGWTLHRIWGTDWYRNRPEAERRLREAVENAVEKAVERPLHTEPAAPVQAAEAPAEPEPEAKPEPVRVPVPQEPARTWTEPYRVASLRVVVSAELHTPEARTQLRSVLAQIVEIEGPIHQDLLVQRAREAWHLDRAGSRIRDNISTVLDGLTRAGLVRWDGEFASGADRRELRARTPVERCTRRVAQVDPRERRLAIRELVAESPGMSQEELVRQVREVFGWKRLGADIRDALETDLVALLAAGELVGSRDRLAVSR